MKGSYTSVQGVERAQRFHSDIAMVLTSCPRAGQGVHHWIWRACCVLRHILTAEEMTALLTVAAKNCGRECGHDIEDAVAKVTGDTEPNRWSAPRPQLQRRAVK